jgi:hypothetical protein
MSQFDGSSFFSSHALNASGSADSSDEYASATGSDAEADCGAVAVHGPTQTQSALADAPAQLSRSSSDSSAMDIWTFLQHAAAAYPARLALVDGGMGMHGAGRMLSYAQLAGRAAQLALRVLQLLPGGQDPTAVILRRRQGKGGQTTGQRPSQAQSIGTIPCRLQHQ